MVAVSLLLVAAGCTGGVARAPAGQSPESAALLAPLWVAGGARLAVSVDGTGTPLLRSGAAPFTRFIGPVAVAASGDDVYVADAGAGRIYRFVRTLDAMVAVAGVAAGPGTRLAVGADFSVYVLDPAARRVQQISRGGQRLATFADPVNVGRPVAMAVDASGGLLVADALYNQIVAFHPLGRASYTIALRGDERNRVLGIAGLALGADAMYVSDPLCRCIARVARDGRVTGTFGHHEIGQPGPIAVDRAGRVFVVDVFAGGIKVFAEGRLIHTLAPAALNVSRVDDVWISEGHLYAADGVAAQVVKLQLIPARRGG